MKQDPFAGVYRALTPKELEESFMNPNIPKTEPEHWAAREIERLRANNERLRAALKPFTDDDRDCLLAEVERLRAENKQLHAEVERLRGEVEWYADPPIA